MELSNSSVLYCCLALWIKGYLERTFSSTVGLTLKGLRMGVIVTHLKFFLDNSKTSGELAILDLLTNTEESARPLGLSMRGKRPVELMI